MAEKISDSLFLYVAKLERFGYWILLLWFSLQPVFVKYFTFDGPAHLYNSVVIKQMFLHGEISSYFSVNPVLVPNWLGHVFLLLFQQVLNPVNSELLLLSLIIFFSNVFFRRFIRSFNGNIWASWLFFPFSMSFLYFMGFYNLVIAVAIMFLLLERLILLNEVKKERVKRYLILSLLFGLIYLSHLFIFLFTGFIALVLILVYSDKRKVVVNLFSLLVVSVVPLYFSILFILKQPKGMYEYIPFSGLIDELLHGRVLVVFGEPELGISTTIVLLVISAVLISFLKYHELFSKAIYISLGIIFFCLTLYFALPNSNGFIGYVSVRLSLLFFVSLIIYLSLAYRENEYFNFLFLFFVVAVTLVSVKRTRQFWGNYSAMNNNYKEMLFVAKNVIPNNCIIYLKNKPEHWFFPHIDNYLGVFSENVVIIESNYELAQKYFPLIENSEESLKGLKVIEVEFNLDGSGDGYVYRGAFISIK